MTTAPSDLVTFRELAGAAIHYARAPVAEYGTRGKGPRAQRLKLAFLTALEDAMSELWYLHPWGRAEVVVSAGAYVAKAGRHGLGRAYDIDALWWPVGVEGPTGAQREVVRRLVTLDAPRQWAHYLAVECVLRRHFGTVLGYAYNRAHRDHWHVDDGSPVGWYPRSKSRCLAVQGCLAHIWGEPVAIDGVWGPRTETAWARALGLDFLGLLEDAWDDAVQVERWRAWLLATARRGFEGV